MNDLRLSVSQSVGAATKSILGLCNLHGLVNELRVRVAWCYVVKKRACGVNLLGLSP